MQYSFHVHLIVNTFYTNQKFQNGSNYYAMKKVLYRFLNFMWNLLIDWTWSTWFHGPKIKPLEAIVGSILLFHRFWWECY